MSSALNISIDDELNSVVAGIFSTNSLFTRFKSIVDLSEEENCMPGAVPAHAHEFIHYLHNISTKCGIKLIYLTHCAISCASHFLNIDKNKINITSNESTQKEDIEFFINNMNYIYGEFNKEKFEDSGEIRKWKFSNLSTYIPMIETKYFSYKINLLINSKEKINGILYIGLSFISEGVAYEVEREIWKKNGTLESDIDKITPDFPYLTYKPLVEYIVGRETTPLERIKIGNSALMHDSPSQGFIESCLALKKSSTDFQKYFFTKMSEFEFFTENSMLEYFSKLEEYYKNTDKLLSPFQHYLSIIKKACKEKLNNPDLELKFIEKNITAKDFLRISSSIAEHLIIQEKTNFKATMDIVGNSKSLATSSENDCTWFFVLCSAIHFIQQHFRKDGKIEKTSNLREKNCPFTGACEVEASSKNPEICKKTPWNIEPNNSNQICWYSAGIKSITPQKNDFSSFHVKNNIHNPTQ